MKTFKRRLLRLIVIATVVVLLIPVGFYLLLTLYDVNRLKPRIERAVSAQTGRAFFIHGNVAFTPGLVPTIRAEQMTLSNPEWTKEKEFTSIGALETSFELWPLLQRRIVVHEITVTDAEVQLEQGAEKSQQSWVFTPAEKAENVTDKVLATAEKETGFRMQTDIGGFNLKNVKLFYRQPQSETKQVMLESGALMFGDKLSLDAAYDYQGVRGNLALTSDGAATLDTLQAQLANKATVHFDAKTPKQNGIIDFNGTLSDVEKGGTLQGDLSVTADSLSAFSPLGGPLPQTQSVSLKSVINASANHIGLTKLKLNFLPQGTVTGKVDATFTGNKPQLNATLLLPAIDVSESASVTETQVRDAASTRPAPTPAGIIPDVALPVDWLQTLNGTFNLTMPRFQSGKILLQNIEAKAVIKDGRLRVAPLQFVSFKGQTLAELDIDSTVKPAHFALRATGTDWLLQEVIRQPDEQGGKLQGGLTQLKARLSGSGASLKPVLRSLSGDTSFLVSDLRYRSPAAAAALTDFFQLLSGKGSGDIKVQCALGRFTLADGVATSQALGMNTSGAIVVGEGTIDLAEERMNVVLRPRAKIIGISDLAVPVRFSGSLNHPSIGLDTRGTALKVGEVALGIATGGGSLGWALFGRNVTDKLGITADSDPCAEPQAVEAQ